MKIWAISDPHLGFGADKMMGIFGNHWDGHADKIAEAWRNTVAPEDAVIISGDVSWAINYEELLPDFQYLHALPGHKYIGRGNHDYWWVSLQKNHQFCQDHGLENFDFIRSNAFRLAPTSEGLLAKGSLLCGTRGWITPYHPEWKQSDEKYLRRELIRLQLTLDAAVKLQTQEEPIILALHYPPFGPNGEETEFTEMIANYGVSICIFGHVHGQKGRLIRESKIGEVVYLNTACDVLDFRPLDIGAALEHLLQ